MSTAHEIVSSRLIPASPEALFTAFRDPVQLAAWWGPAGFTNEFHLFEFRPGGAWRFTMSGPDGAGYAMDHRFLEVVPVERIMVRHIQPGHDFTLTVTLAPLAGGTRVTWLMVFDDPAEAVRVRALVLPANEQNLDRLESFLAPTLSESS